MDFLANDYSKLLGKGLSNIKKNTQIKNFILRMQKKEKKLIYFLQLIEQNMD